MGDVDIYGCRHGWRCRARTGRLACPPARPSLSPRSIHLTMSSMAMARHSFRSARTMEGKTEEEAFPRDAPPEIELEHIRQAWDKHAGPEHKTVPAAPIVRKLAREIGVDIYLVKGSGPGRTHQ